MACKLGLAAQGDVERPCLPRSASLCHLLAAGLCLQSGHARGRLPSEPSPPSAYQASRKDYSIQCQATPECKVGPARRKTSPLSMSATAAMRLPPVLPKAKTAECRLQPISLKLQKHTSEYTASPKQPTADTAKLPSMPESQSLGVESASHGSHLLQPSFCKCREQSYVSQLQLLSSLCLSSESSGLACLASIHASSFKTVSDHSMAKPRASADGKACFTPVPVPLRTAPLCRSCCRRPPSDGHRPGTGLARRPKGDPLSFRTSGVMPRQPSSPPAREVNPGLTDHATPAD